MTDASSLNASAGSFYLYGQKHKTLSNKPSVGDAVVFGYNGAGDAQHVAIVSQVNSNGTIETISGDWAGQSGTEAQFSSTSSVVVNQPAYFAGAGTDPSTMGGMKISGYIAPAGFTMGGAIFSHFLALGGASFLPLGYPVTNELIARDGVGRYNRFQAGAIYWSPATGAWSVDGAIYGHWAGLGAARSPLGYPVTDERGTPDGIGRFNHFSNDGSIYWTATTGAWSIRGAIRNHWAALGWERSPLGYPISDETGTPDGIGRTSAFSNDGSIYWTQTTGAWSMHGAIRDHWVALGSEQSPLGYPISDEAGTRDGQSRFNAFQHGALYWTAAFGAHEVNGPVYQAWSSLGGEAGRLGFPTSDPFAVTAGVRNNFQHGAITYDPTLGTVMVTYS